MAEKAATQSQETRGKSLCWNCQSEIHSVFFCVNCVKVQPISHESDYFSIFGLPRKLKLHPAALEAKYHELSRKLHPDFYQGKTETEKVYSLDNSAVVNAAYRTLKDPFLRMEYLVKLEEGASKEIEKKAPQDLLSEMLEFQENLVEYQSSRDGAETERLRHSLAESLSLLRSRLSQDAERAESLFEKWDALVTSGAGRPEEKKALLSQMKEILSNRAYLERVVNGISEEIE